MNSFADIINRWPSLTEFASDLSVPYGTAKQWRRRGAIPSQWWSRTIEAAQTRGYFDITADILTRFASQSVAAA